MIGLYEEEWNGYMVHGSRFAFFFFVAACFLGGGIMRGFLYLFGVQVDVARAYYSV